MEQTGSDKFSALKNRNIRHTNRILIIVFFNPPKLTKFKKPTLPHHETFFLPLVPSAVGRSFPACFVDRLPS